MDWIGLVAVETARMAGLCELSLSMLNIEVLPTSARLRELLTHGSSRSRAVTSALSNQHGWCHCSSHPTQNCLDSYLMNISGTLNVFRLIRDPALCLPQHTVSTFNHLPVPLSKAFPKRDGQKDVDIRAVVLDKDNCFAIAHTNEVHPPYHVSDLSIKTLAPQK